MHDGQHAPDKISASDAKQNIFGAEYAAEDIVMIPPGSQEGRLSRLRRTTSE